MKPAIAHDTTPASKPLSPHRNANQSKNVQAKELRSRLLNMILDNEQQRRSDFVPRPSTPK